MILDQFSCELHHCGHPNQDEGSHPHPPDINNILLVENSQTEAKHVPYGTNIIYQCKDNHFIENTEVDPTKNSIKVSTSKGRRDFILETT